MRCQGDNNKLSESDNPKIYKENNMPSSSSFSRHFLFLALATSSLVVLPVAANAVVVPDVARPETIQRQLKVDQRPELSAKPVITIQDQGEKELKGDISFVLKAIEFEGGTQIKAEDLKQFYQDKIGKKVTLAELNAVAAKITAHYRNKGFILTKAIVPPQRIDKGIVKIRIIEGFVSDVQLKGDVGSANSVLYKYAEKIKQSKPLDAATLEHYLLLMEDLPGVEARAVLQPSPTIPGASQIIVNIKRDAGEGTTVVVNNRGTRYLGPIQATAILSGNNIVGMDEQTSLRVINTPMFHDELRYIGGHHEAQIGAQGTKLLLDGNFVQTRPGYTLEAFEIRGQSYNVAAGASHPVIRSRQTNWYVNSDFSVQRASLNSLGTNLYQDNLRVLRAGSTYDFIDPLDAVNRIDASIYKGFSWNTDNDGLSHSRANGKANFWKATANVTRLQPVYGSWSVSAALDGQYSLNPLYSSAEYALGGQQFGSAFDSAELSGDSAIAGRLELQYSGTTSHKYLSSYQPYGFYDAGKVWNRNNLSTSDAKSASLSSAGLGARVNMAESLTGSMELAFPLTEKVATAGADGYAPRFFFNLQYRY